MQPVQSSDHLEVARAALCCLSYQDEYTARPVHFQRISAALKYHIPAELVLPVLEIAAELQEFAKLPLGYWYPAPLRCVPFHSIELIIGPHPTNELHRTISQSIERVGQARIVREASVTSLPKQNLNEWLDRDPDLRAWTSALLSQANAQMKPALADVSVCEVYRPTERPRWRSIGKEVRALEGTYICRQSIFNGGRHYFFGKFRANRLVMEANNGKWDYRRAQFGMDLLVGQKNNFLYQTHEAVVHVRFPKKLPSAEHRLLIALGRQMSMDNAVADYVVPNEFFNVIENELVKLGLYGKRSEQ